MRRRSLFPSGSIRTKSAGFLHRPSESSWQAARRGVGHVTEGGVVAGRPGTGPRTRRGQVRPSGSGDLAGDGGAGSPEGVDPRCGFEPQFTGSEPVVLPLDDRGSRRRVFVPKPRRSSTVRPRASGGHRARPSRVGRRAEPPWGRVAEDRPPHRPCGSRRAPSADSPAARARSPPRTPSPASGTRPARRRARRAAPPRRPPPA